jgi:hypothetical protein
MIRREAHAGGGRRGAPAWVACALACLSVVALAAHCDAACTASQIEKMIDKDFSKREIDEICGKSEKAKRRADDEEAPARMPSADYPQQPQMPRPGTFCITQAGSCVLVSPWPVGSACTCLTPLGPIPGVVN